MSHQKHQVMARFRAALHPIHSIKHVIDTSAGNVAAGTNVNVNLIKAVDNPDALTNQEDIAVRAKVNGIYLDVEVSCDEDVVAQIPNAYMIVYKSPAGVVPAILPAVVGTTANKRFVIHQEMVMLDGHAVGNPRTLFKGVISIPKSFRTFADGDQLQLRIQAPSVKFNYCVQCIYKELR